MSYAYSQVIPEAVSHKTYGFQSVSPKEMHSIVRRLGKPTYNSDLYHSERFQQTPCPPRLPSTQCKRAKSASTDKPPSRPQPFFTSDRELDRAYKRIRSYTISKRAAEGQIAPTYETNFERQYLQVNMKQYTVREQKKMMRRLLRPTTSLKNKHFCAFCDDPKITEYDMYDFSANNDCAPQKIIQNIVDRVRTPTIASEGGIGPTCPKRKDSVGKWATISDIPLVSGLPRSKSVHEIVNRLYTPTEAIPMCRPVSATTPRRRDMTSSKTKRPKSAFVSQSGVSLSSFSTASFNSTSSTNSKQSMQFSTDDNHYGDSKTAIFISRKPPNSRGKAGNLTVKKKETAKSDKVETRNKNEDTKNVENEDVENTKQSVRCIEDEDYTREKHAADGDINDVKSSPSDATKSELNPDENETGNSSAKLHSEGNTHWTRQIQPPSIGQNDYDNGNETSSESQEPDSQNETPADSSNRHNHDSDQEIQERDGVNEQALSLSRSSGRNSPYRYADDSIGTSGSAPTPRPYSSTESLLGFTGGCRGQVPDSPASLSSLSEGRKSRVYSSSHSHAEC